MQGMSDSFNDTPRPQLNYSMLAQQQQTANSMFEQQVQSSKNDYSAALNMQVTGQAAEELKAGYITEAQKKLREVATQDLLLPKTAAQAQQVFEPFWSDERLLRNSGITKTLNSRIAKVQRGLLSTDEEERSMHDPVQLEYLNHGYKELERAGTDLNKLRSIRSRDIIPVRNVFDALSKAATDMKMEVKRDSENGFYLVNKEGGRDSVPNWTTFAQGVLSDPSWRPQFEMYAQVEVDRKKDYFLAANPTLTERDLNSTIAQDVISDVDKTFAEETSNITANLSALQERLKQIKANESKIENGKRVPLQSALEKTIETTQSIAYLQQMQKGNEDNIRKWEVDKKKSFASIEQSPEQYYYKVFQQKAINSFVASASSREIITIKENQGYNNSVTAAREFRELQRKIDKDAEDTRQFNITADLTMRKNLADAAATNIDLASSLYKNYVTPDVFSGTAGVGNGVANSPSGYEADNTQLTEVDNVVARYYAQMENMADGIVSTSIGAGKGQLGGFLLGKPTPQGDITTQDLSLATTALTNKQHDADYKYSTIENAALEKIGSLIGANVPVDKKQATQTPYKISNKNNPEDFTGEDYIGLKTSLSNNGYKDPVVFQNKLRSYLRNQATGIDTRSFTINSTLNIIEEQEEKLVAEKRKLDATVKEYADMHPEYKTALLKGEQIKGDFPEVTIVAPDGTERRITQKEYADKWISGDITRIEEGLGHGLSITVDGQRFDVKDIPNMPGVTLPGLQQYQYTLSKKYGNPNNNKKLGIELNKKAISSNQSLKEMSGSRGKRSTVTTGTPAGNAYLNNTTVALSNPSNVGNIYDATGTLITDPATKQALFELLKARTGTGQNSIPKYVPAATMTTLGGPNKVPSVQLSFATVSGEDKNIVGGQKVLDIIGKGPITMEVDPNTTNAILKNITPRENDYMYAEVLEGKPLPPSAGMKNSNYNVSIQKVPTGFKLVGTIRKLNPVTGIMEDIPLTNPRTGEVGVLLESVEDGKKGGYTITDAVEERNKFWSRLQMENIAAMNVYKAKEQGTTSFDEIENKLGYKNN